MKTTRIPFRGKRGDALEFIILLPVFLAFLLLTVSLSVRADAEEAVQNDAWISCRAASKEATYANAVDSAKNYLTSVAADEEGTNEYNTDFSSGCFAVSVLTSDAGQEYMSYEFDSDYFSDYFSFSGTMTDAPETYWADGSYVRVYLRKTSLLSSSSLSLSGIFFGENAFSTEVTCQIEEGE